MANRIQKLSSPNIFPIGHSSRKISEFIEILYSYKLKLVVDILTIPKSRHNPQFGAQRMINAMMLLDE